METKNTESSKIEEVTNPNDLTTTIKQRVEIYQRLLRRFKGINNPDNDYKIFLVSKNSGEIDLGSIIHFRPYNIENIDYNSYFLEQHDLAKSELAIDTVSSRKKTKSQAKSQNEEIISILAQLSEKIESLSDNIIKLRKENNLLKELLFSESTSYNDTIKTQTIPIEIYLDTNDPVQIFEVYDSVMRFTKSIGFDESLEFEAIKGSWYKKIIAKSKEKLSSDEVLDRLKEVEYGIEVNTILKQQSEIDKNQSEAFSNILNSIKDIPNAAIRIGALIVVKVTNEEGYVSVQTRTLSIKELHLLNKKPELLQQPKQILQALAKEIEDEKPPELSEN